MNQQKSLMNHSSLLVHSLFILFSLGMIVVSLYLTKHYFDVTFPTDLTQASACNINQFFNCDKATLSRASNIFGVPISLFGTLLGIFFLFGYLFKNEEAEGTNHFLGLLNVAGCLILLIISLFSLKGLCPFCTIYYALSFGVAFLFFKFSTIRKPSPRVLTIYAILTLVPAIALGLVSKDKSVMKAGLKESLITQFKGLENLGNPKVDSPYRLLSSAEKFSDAPIQISIFSDFQCPACKALGEQLHPLLARFSDKINVQYFFYPLDTACNSQMTSAIHPHACQAAYLASCLPQKFLEIHDEIFNNQESISAEWLLELARKNNVVDCMQSAETAAKVKALVEIGSQFDVRSTPTMILNGVKIEGVLPTNQLQMLIEELLSK